MRAWWSRMEDRYFAAIMWIAKNVHGGVVAALTLLGWPVVGLFVPVLLKVDTGWLVNLNLYGTFFAVSLVIAWLVVQLQAKDRRHLLEWTSDLRMLDAQEFEFLVGEVLRREGWTVEERGRQGGPDGNIDLEIRRGKEDRIVQAKRWQSWQVGVDDVRAFGGTLMREGKKGDAGIFVTLSDFTPQAREEAKTLGLELVDGADLAARMDKVRKAVPCPICQQPMRFGRSIHGWWFRCVAPGCDGKQDLGAQPEKVIALLTEQQ
ncbi:MAG TPA: restriction endonuclease [Galbitalea sp.]|jgi:hypothetical protein